MSTGIRTEAEYRLQAVRDLFNDVAMVVDGNVIVAGGPPGRGFWNDLAAALGHEVGGHDE